jgi:RNA polymerase sigma factor (sigma-70 family)
MRQRGLNGLLDFLRRGVPPPGPDLVSDGELLGRFAEARDEAAFELLVRRHGSMVYGVARRILNDAHAAEDVLQAVFLALARQAKSLRRRPAVAAWLYRVAVRVAHKARPRPAVYVSRPPSAAADTAVLQAELRTVIDDAVTRLPAKLRDAVVLCYLSGHTTEEAARQLGRPKETILSRLAAARERLRADLARRGVAPVTAAFVTSELSPAVLSPALVSLAVQAAGPPAALSAAVVTLAQGAIVTMSWSKLSVTAAAGVLFGVIGFGLAGGQPGPGAPPKNKVAVVPDAMDVLLNDLREAENEVQQHMKAMAQERVALRRQIAVAEQRIKTLQDGLKALETQFAILPVARLVNDIDPNALAGIFPENTTPKPVVTLAEKANLRLREAQAELCELQEQLRLREELAAFQLEVLKRNYNNLANRLR